MVSTVIINPHSDERKSTAALLSVAEDISVVAEGKDGYDALRLVGRYKPDIAILDNQLEFIDAGQIPPLLKMRSPSTSAIILAAQMTDSQIQLAAHNDVSGFVHKQDLHLLPKIINCVSGGGCFISPQLGTRVRQVLSADTREYQAKSPCAGEAEFFPRQDPVEYLSKIELQILAFVGEGNTSDEIAAKLGVTAGTVRNYISAIMRKSGLHNRAQLAIYAFFYGLVTFPPDFAASA